MLVNEDVYNKVIQIKTYSFYNIYFSLIGPSKRIYIYICVCVCGERERERERERETERQRQRTNWRKGNFNVKMSMLWRFGFNGPSSGPGKDDMKWR